ncbi:Methyltransferase domain [Carpediemonas membranifera]|uniref:Methyltransferase domain n=1 Tax=Carpediemonas membranifera TaxID=201153 RepID=A0A8J6E473_9EUKA|nr:Methyltransferase domain [Carpediemonas membranifera]|eukprot:KAG9394102.1 Methyltransferase domain [Carpediemonas membranifera]
MSEEENSTLKIFLEMHRNCRFAPGSDSLTKRALLSANSVAECALPSDVLDIGCGTGNSTAIIADMFPLATVFAGDIEPDFVQRVRDRFAQNPNVCVASMDMAHLDAFFQPETLDLILCEASVDNVGFGSALTAWSQILRAGGVAIVSELCMYGSKSKMPEEAFEYWTEAKEDITTERQLRQVAVCSGYTVISEFRVSPDEWAAYHHCLRGNIEKLKSRALVTGDVARREVEKMEREMDMVERHPECCGYTYFVLQKN